MSNGEEQPYREGDTPDPPQEQEQQQEAVMPETAFLVVKLPDGTVDVVTDLEEMFPSYRKPSIGEIRNMAMAVAQDGQGQVIANFVAMHLTQAMQKMAVNRQISDIQRAMKQPNLVVPPGAKR